MIDSRARAVIRNLKTYKPGKPIEEVKRELNLKSVIKLASNENALGPSPKAVIALKQAAVNINRYPESTAPLLRTKLANKLKVEPQSLIFGNGSDELIVLALRAFIDPGEEVVVAQPTFLIYEQQARACGAHVNVVAMKDYRYDLIAMRQQVTPNTKLLFIANPDNPTGSYVTKKEFQRFLGDLPAETIVFLDEAYYEYVEEKDYPQSLQMRGEQSLIITRTFSKAYGLAGLRVGYGIAAPSIISAMEAVREPFNVNSLAQVAASAALDDSIFLKRVLRMTAEGKSYLIKAFLQLKLRFLPSATNFILLNVGPNATEIAGALLKHGVIVREMSGWNLSGFIRVTIGTMSENRKFIQELKRCLAS